MRMAAPREVKLSGAEAEDLALRFLLGQGLKLRERNYRCPLGEIDLILLDGKTLVFVEVRSRSHRGYGGAAESITAGKREKLLAAAGHYLAQLKSTPACRFDALLLDASRNPQWIKDAFGE